MPPPPSSPNSANSNTLQAPTGTRDFYPADLNRLRYIQDAWRKTSIRHGFDEIDGPTFEHLETYTIKSGEGIVSELFSFERFGGEKKFALRPEFTPTLARMYAAKAASLPKPTKWFWQQNCFRAERPQRGRLREFVQWNCDIIGDDSVTADAELISACVQCLSDLGLDPKHVRIKLNDRTVITVILRELGFADENHAPLMDLLDRRSKVSGEEFAWAAAERGLSRPQIAAIDDLIANVRGHGWMAVMNDMFPGDSDDLPIRDRFFDLAECLRSMGLEPWWVFDPTIVRGLAYYTGMVFEVHEATGAERAIAGGGRYDKLIELFGGPPTPAVGFGMGDVVLSLVLQDKGLMPSDADIAKRLGLAPDCFVFAAADAADAAITGVVASLRRAGLHARRTNKTTRNIGKLLKDASSLGACYAVILHSPETCSLKNMATQEQIDNVPVTELVSRIGPVGR